MNDPHLDDIAERVADAMMAHFASLERCGLNYPLRDGPILPATFADLRCQRLGIAAMGCNPLSYTIWQLEKAIATCGRRAAVTRNPFSTN